MAIPGLWLDVDFKFDTPEVAAESEDILLRLITLMAKMSLRFLRRNPRTPRIYSKAAGIRYVPPDQACSTWVPRSKYEELEGYLKSLGMRSDRISILMRLVDGCEIFRDAASLYREGKGDCDRLVAARLGELWYAGVLAGPYLIPYPNESGGTTYHAVVLHGDNTTEDPSLILGMAGPKGAREEEIRKNLERRDNLLAHALTLVDVGGDINALGAAIDASGYCPIGGYPRWLH